MPHNSCEQHSKNKSSSASIGVSFGTDGLLLNLSASGARGKANGTDIEHTHTEVDAGQKLIVESGRDTNLKGAPAKGKHIQAHIGRDLNIESVQDSSTYDSKQQSLGGSLSVGYGKMSGSFSASQSKVNSDYQSVTEQSGFKAGDGGFNIHVQGNTDLKAGLIASTDQAAADNKNTLTTGTLTTSDLHNKAEYEASSISVSAGTTSLSSVPNPAGMGFGSDSDSQSSTTKAGISQANLTITDHEKQKALTGKDAEQTLADLNRDVSTDKDTSGALTNKFDATRVHNEVDAQTQITQTLGKEASQTIAHYAAPQIEKASILQQQAQKTNDAKQQALLQSQAQQLLNNWGDANQAGHLRVLAHTVLGGLSGGLAGAVGAGAATAVGSELKHTLHQSGLNPTLTSALTTLAATATGALAGVIIAEVAGATAHGSGAPSALIGAATAYNEITNNTLYLWRQKLIATDKQKNDKVIVLGQHDAQKLQATLTAQQVGGMVGGYAVPLNTEAIGDHWQHTLTDSPVYSLADARHFEQLRKTTAMGYHAIDEQQTKIYFQNGVDNATPAAKASSQLIAEWVKIPVGNIINDTHGIAGDVAEYLPSQLHTKDVLNEYTYRKLNAKNQPLLIVTHSAGNGDAHKALQVGALHGYHYPNLSFITVGSPISQKKMQAAITQAGAQHLGHIGDWRDPVTYSKTTAISVLGLIGTGVVSGVTIGVTKGAAVAAPLGVGGGPLGVFLMGTAGGLAGLGPSIYGVSYHHPFAAYMQKSELQHLLLNWRRMTETGKGK